MDSIGNVIDKLKLIAYQSMPIKGTYIKTLKQEDIFEEPIQKTTELKRVNIGNQSILVPIIKEEIVKPTLSDDIVMKLLSKIKDVKSRQILETYKQQENINKPPVFPQLPEEKQQEIRTTAMDNEGDDPELLKERKTELVKKAKDLKTSNDYLQFLDQEKIAEFQSDLKKNKMSSVLGGFNRSLKLVKDKLSSIDAREKYKIEKAERDKQEAEKKRLADEEKERKRKAKQEADATALLLKQQQEQQAKLAEQNEAALKAQQAKTALELSTATSTASAAQEDIEARKKAAKIKELRELEVEHARAESEAQIRKKHLTEAQQLVATSQPPEEVLVTPTPAAAAPVAAEPAAEPSTPSPKKKKKKAAAAAEVEPPTPPTPPTPPKNPVGRPPKQKK